MKKSAAILVAWVLIVLATGPWFMGGIAHSRFDRGLDKLVEQVPYIKVAERKWTRGWLHSQSEVTFEFVVPGLSSKPVAALADAAPGAPEAAADEPAAQAIPKFPMLPPARFTLRSEVLHGPLLGLSGFGLARADTKFVLSEQVRAKLIEVMGTDEPVRISTRLAFLGGGTTTLSGDARTIPLAKFGLPGDKGTVAWDAFSLSIGTGRAGRWYDFRGRQPRIEFKSPDGAEHVKFADLTLDGKGSRVSEDLYDGDMAFGVGKMSIASTRTPAVDISSLKYAFSSTSKGDFFDYSMQMGTGEVKTAALDQLKFQLKGVHYDFSLRHLHAPTLQKLTRAIRDAYSKTIDNPLAAQTAMMGPLAEHGRELLKHDPEFVIDRVGVETPQGEAVLRGVIKAPGVTEEDLKAGAMALLPKLVADLNFEAPQALFDNVPNGNMMMGLGIDQGYVKREGKKIVSHIEFKGGKLTINGKTPALPPMFGGQPPAPAEPAPPAGG